ncbi:hypothetical protein FZC66_05080 [Priestia megaterium]|nr:hypothetical protein FZC66_05080 [Priestia megaterium]
MGVGRRLILFFIGILLKVIGVMSLVMELSLVPIHGRTSEYYAEAFDGKVPFLLFIIGFICIIISFYLPVKNKKASK